MWGIVGESAYVKVKQLDFGSALCWGPDDSDNQVQRIYSRTDEFWYVKTDLAVPATSEK